MFNRCTDSPCWHLNSMGRKQDINVGKTAAASSAAGCNSPDTVSGVRANNNPPVLHQQETKGGSSKALDNKANQSNPNHISYWKARGYQVENQDHVNFLNEKANLGKLKEPAVFNAFKANLNANGQPKKKSPTAPASLASIPVPRFDSSGNPRGNQKNYSAEKRSEAKPSSTVRFVNSGQAPTVATRQRQNVLNANLRGKAFERQKVSPALRKLASISPSSLPQGMQGVQKVIRKMIASVRRGTPKYQGKMGGNHHIYQNVDLRDPAKFGPNVRKTPSIKSVYGPFGEAKMLISEKITPLDIAALMKSGELPSCIAGMAVVTVDETGNIIQIGVKDLSGDTVSPSSVVSLLSEPMQDRHVSDMLEDYGGKKRVEKLEKEVSSMKMVRMNESRELQDVVRDEVFVKRVKYMWILNALLPELYENIGIPDQFNSSASIFPTLVTRFLCTFQTTADQNRCCAVIVQEDMQDLIRVLGQGGDSTVDSTPFTNLFPGYGGTQWLAYPYNQSGDPVIYENAGCYLADNITSQFYVNSQTFRSAGLNSTVQIEKATVGGSDYYYVPVDTGSSFIISASTSDTTMNGYTSQCSFVLRTGGPVGTLSVVTSSAVNGTGNGAVVTFSHTPPANSIGVYGYTVANAAAATVQLTTPATVIVSITSDPMDLVVGIGKSDGSDIAFFKEFCSELRMVSMSVRGMPYCSALGNLLFTGGQFLDSESDTILSPTFQNWSANQLFFMKQMVNGSASGFEFPILKRDYATINFYNLDADDEDRIVERGGVWLQGVSDESDYVAFEIYNGIQGHPVLGIQALDAKPGICCEEALDEGNTFLNEHRLKFDNDDHVAECEALAKQSVTNNYTLSLFNGNTLKNIAV